MRACYVLMAWAGACGGGGGTMTPDAGGGSTVTPPAPPEAVQPPSLTPCPAGWREVAPETPDGVATCDPWPETGAADCVVGQAHFPGEPGCASVGAPCPAGDWPEGLPAGGAVRYVQAGATPGGDGTLGAPYATIGEALVAPPSGLIVAIAKGEYDENLALIG